jgi:Family of unknown function (DUF6221)
MSDLALIAFLRVRADEDEAVAKAAADSGGNEMWFTKEAASAWFDTQVAAHVIRFDPSRVLREVAARRKIINAYESAATADRYSLSLDAAPIDHYQSGLEVAVRALAAVDAAHPDYKPAWGTP